MKKVVSKTAICLCMVVMSLFFMGQVKVVNATRIEKTTQVTTEQTTQKISTESQTTQAPMQPTTEVVKKKYKKPGKTKVSGQYLKKKVKLTWKKVKKADTYLVYRKNKSGKYVKIGSTSKLTYSDKKAKKGKYYYYKVMAAYRADGKLITGKKSAACKVLADNVDPEKPMVALTFDDGPGPYTASILKCLKENNSRATFFVLGNRVNSYKDEIRQADKIGCEIASHSYDHSNLANLTQVQVKKQMDDTDANIEAIIGKKTKLMRTPYGSTTQSVRGAVGKPVILWSIDTLDWKTRNAGKTVDSVMSNVKDGSIVLMHDIHSPTKDAVLTLVPRLRSRGYQLVTVSELAKYRGYKLKRGNVYYSLTK